MCLGEGQYLYRHPQPLPTDSLSPAVAASLASGHLDPIQHSALFQACPHPHSSRPQPKSLQLSQTSDSVFSRANQVPFPQNPYRCRLYWDWVREGDG